MDKHQKHTKLKLRNNNNFAPNEIAVLGTKCDVISELIKAISTNLEQYKLAYLDASHSKEIKNNNLETFTFHSSGNLNSNSNFQINKFNQRVQFSPFDFVFINGNHYQGAKQLLILDAEKEVLVLKRLEQLDDIQFIVKLNKDASYFNFLEKHNPQIKNLRCYHISEINEISKHIENLIKEKIASIQGLVLAGGKSKRMGIDKGQLDFYGKKQRNVAIELLENNNIKTYLSVRAAQNIDIKNKITDKFIGLGPFGAICSAFQQNPNSAWLVLATDVPFVNNEIIQLLLKHRNPSKMATTIKGKNKKFPEPLITIWEPKSYTLLLNYLAQGYSCPRKILINSAIEIVEVDDSFIRNINTTEEYKVAYKEINV